MGAKTLPYSEGTCFALPLREGGFARGVVARSNSTGVVFGYFFGPKLGSFSDAVVDDSLKPEKSVLQARFGDLGLLKGEWRIIGKVEPWDRAGWRLPGFLHLDAEGDRGFVRYYDDSLGFLKEDRVAVSAIGTSVPRDGLLGYGAVEIRLTKLLAPS